MSTMTILLDSLSFFRNSKIQSKNRQEKPSSRLLHPTTSYFLSIPMSNTSNHQLDCSRMAVISAFLLMVLITLFQFNKDEIVLQSIESSQRIGYAGAPKEEEKGE